MILPWFPLPLVPGSNEGNLSSGFASSSCSARFLKFCMWHVSLWFFPESKQQRHRSDFADFENHAFSQRLIQMSKSAGHMDELPSAVYDLYMGLVRNNNEMSLSKYLLSIFLTELTKNCENKALDETCYLFAC